MHLRVYPRAGLRENPYGNFPQSKTWGNFPRVSLFCAASKSQDPKSLNHRFGDSPERSEIFGFFRSKTPGPAACTLRLLQGPTRDAVRGYGKKLDAANVHPAHWHHIPRCTLRIHPRAPLRIAPGVGCQMTDAEVLTRLYDGAAPVFC